MADRLDAPTDVLVGPSRHLPGPLGAVARRAWDEASVQYRRARSALPPRMAQALGASAELVQRPHLEVARASTEDGASVVVLGNDPLIRSAVFTALGTSEPSRTGTFPRVRVKPDLELPGDLVVVEVPTLSARSFARAGFVVLPRWVALEVDLGKPETELWDAKKRETVRRIERSSLELEVARDRPAAREFHERLYAPTARARHGALSIVVRPTFVEAALRTGSLLFVRSGGRRRAGLLAVPRLGAPRGVDILLSGVESGDYAETELARAAAYLFAIRWARDAFGATVLGLTGAAPFVKDGILRHKKRWGATAVADLRQASCLGVRLSSGSPALVSALANEPLVAIHRWDTRPALAALSLRAGGSEPPDLPETPGILRVDVPFQSPDDVPSVLSAWARAS